MHVDVVDKDIVLTVHEVPWTKLTITLQDERGMSLPKYQIKMMQFPAGVAEPFGEISTDEWGKCTVRCIDDMTYGLQTRRPTTRGNITSAQFVPAKLPKPEYTFVVPSLTAVSFRFRFVVRNGELVHPLEDISGCEIAEAGAISSIDGIFYLQPNIDDDAKRIYATGATRTMRLPVDVAERYDFADGKGLLIIGKIGEIRDVELIPRLRYAMAIGVVSSDGKLLSDAEVTYRAVGDKSWYVAQGSLKELTAGKYELHAWVPGYRMVSQTVDAKVGKADFKMELGPKADFTIHGPDDKPLQGVAIMIDYASKDYGSHYQPIRTDANGQASANYDDTHEPVAEVFAKGFAPHLVALTKETAKYPIKLAPAVTTKVSFRPQGALALQLTNVTWVAQKPAHFRVASTILKAGTGEVVLEPGEYVPILELPAQPGPGPGNYDKVMVCKPVKIADGSAVELIPDGIKPITEVVDGPR